MPLGGRLADQSLGLWVLLPLGHVQAIEKDRSQVFSWGVMRGLSTKDTGVPERKLDCSLRSRRVQPDRARLQSQARPQPCGAAKADCRAPD